MIPYIEKISLSQEPETGRLFLPQPPFDRAVVLRGKDQIDAGMIADAVLEVLIVDIIPVTTSDVRIR